jgi:uncharacterized damage-inducible protein DinB
VSEKLSAVTTKQDLIAYTTTAWNTLVTYVDGLPAEQWTEPRDAAGWSVKDHVSHVTHWDRAVIEALRNQVPMRETLGISETAWSAGSFDPMNEEIRRLADTEGVARVKADRDATWTDLVVQMGELSEEQLAQSGAAAGLAVGTEPLVEPVLEVLADYWGAHYAEHLQDIQAIVDSDAATKTG